MASVSNDKGSSKRIQFFDGSGKRRALRLGKITKRQAEYIARRVEQLVGEKFSGHVRDDETSRWLNSIDDSLYDKLAKIGLVAPRQSQDLELGKYLDDYIAGRTDVKPRTAINYEQAARNLTDYFGRDRKLSCITPGECDQWRVWLLERLAENTARRHCGRAKQFFRAALRRKLINENPFADMKNCGVAPSDPSRQFFLSEADSLKILKACPTLQWKLIFALARWQALRTPSEPLRLRWSDIDFENRVMVIHQPKMETRGKPTRTMRIFEPVLSLLAELRDIVQPGIECPFSAPILHAEQGDSVNWRRMFEKIVNRAGVEPWPKLFQALRATRETELASKLPLHVVTAWCGNTPTVALKHYLMTTGEHFELASSLDVSVSTELSESGAEVAHSQDDAPTQAAQNPAHHLSELGGIGNHQKKEPLEIPRNSEGFHSVLSAECPGEDLNLHGE